MILQLLQDIKHALKATPDLRLIDFDRGQIEEPDSFDALLFPCVLVSIPDIDWQDLNAGNQTGDCIFITKTIVKLPHNTAFYINSEYEHEHLEPLTSANLNELQIEDAIHQELIKINSVVRTATKEYQAFNSGSQVWITEHTYNINLYYQNTPRYQRKETKTNLAIDINLNLNN